MREEVCDVNPVSRGVSCHTVWAAAYGYEAHYLVGPAVDHNNVIAPEVGGIDEVSQRVGADPLRKDALASRADSGRHGVGLAVDRLQGARAIRFGDVRVDGIAMRVGGDTLVAARAGN